MLLDQLLDRLIGFFSSMRLTVVCLALALVLVFWGTLAQVELGLYKAQNEFFRSFFIFWQPAGAGWRIPIFPGGYLVGGLDNEVKDPIEFNAKAKVGDFQPDALRRLGGTL